jgi:hypothetical protein
MASKKLPTRENQKTLYTGRTEKRIALLKEKGLSEKDIAKDSKIKQLKAKLKQLASAIARISFLDEQKKQLRREKNSEKRKPKQLKLHRPLRRRRRRRSRERKKRLPLTRRRLPPQSLLPRKRRNKLLRANLKSMIESHTQLDIRSYDHNAAGDTHPRSIRIGNC